MFFIHFPFVLFLYDFEKIKELEKHFETPTKFLVIMFYLID